MNLIEISVSDELTPAFKRMLANNKNYLKSVSKSLGYYIQKEIKEGVRKGVLYHTDDGWNQIWFTEGNIQPRRELQGHASRYLYGQMIRAVGYQYMPDSISTVIGWTSKSSAEYGRRNELGGRQPVTESIRRIFYNAYDAELERYGSIVEGRDYDKYIYPLSKKKKELITPARPIFEPMMTRIHDDFAPYIERKVQSYIEGNVKFGKKNKRVYKVYGG